MDQELLLWKEKYDLQYTLSCLQRQREEKEQERRLALYEKREADAAAAEYSTTIRSLRDRLAGTFRENQEQLNHQAKHASYRWEQAKEALDSQDTAIRRTRERLDAICTEPFRWESEPEERCRAMAAIKTGYLLKGLPVLFTQCQEGLTLAREWSRPRMEMDPQKLREMQWNSTGKANTAAKQICGVLQELNRLLPLLDRKTIPSGGYFENPDGFLVSAAKYGNLDRINRALDQVSSCEKECRAMLSEEFREAE